jgi:hypothetical protein
MIWKTVERPIDPSLFRSNQYSKIVDDIIADKIDLVFFDLGLHLKMRQKNRVTEPLMVEAITA